MTLSSSAGVGSGGKSPRKKGLEVLLGRFPSSPTTGRGKRGSAGLYGASKAIPEEEEEDDSQRVRAGELLRIVLPFASLCFPSRLAPNRTPRFPPLGEG
jgi:hypothetical protein